MFIGRIITNSKNFKPLDFVEKTGILEVDNTIPTLIIGRANAEAIYGKERVKILNKQIESNVWWTFGKTERRVDYEEDIEKFYSNVIKKLQDKIKYQYFNIFTEDKGRICSFIDWLYKGGKKYIYIVNSHIYIYYSNKTFEQNTVYGLSFNDIEYIGKEKECVIEKLKANINNIFINDVDFISQDFIKKLGEKTNILVPYLYFLSRE